MLSLSKFEITHKDLIIEHIQENAHRDQTRTDINITRILGGKIWQPAYDSEKYNKKIPLSWTIMTNEIEAHVKMKVIRMWATEYFNGQGCKFHNHKNESADMTAVYYLKVGNESGNLIFPDKGITIEPRENYFVLFNTNLLHGVEPSLDGRICISMNFKKQ